MPNHPLIRLEEKEIQAIREIFSTYFSPEDKLWIFGSRVHLEKKGGDIDLYVETRYTDPKEVVKARLHFLGDLKEKIGDQKIDLVIKFGDFDLPIHHVARAEGIQLV